MHIKICIFYAAKLIPLLYVYQNSSSIFVICLQEFTNQQAVGTSAKTETGTFIMHALKVFLKLMRLLLPIRLQLEILLILSLKMKLAIPPLSIIFYERKNYIARSSPRHKKQHHIIASNLDQALIIATLKEPKTSQGFIDRCLVAAEAYHVPSIIVFNKIDIYKKKEWEAFDKLQHIYNDVGYPVYKISMKTLEGLDKLKSFLQNKITLFYGHSGTGKSTLINYLLPTLELRTKEVSDWSGKGMHTTTFAEMFDLPSEGKIIDTPGIREFAIDDMERYELSHYFPEMRNLLQNCRFNNCLHIEEPGCAIKQAVEEGKIYMERYISYYNILQSISENNY